MLSRDPILNAFRLLGTRLVRDTEILIVGGTAGLLTGEFPPTHVTEDVDLIACHLPADRDAVLDAAEQIGNELSLPASWLSDFSGLFRWTLLDDWRGRAVNVGTFGKLRVLAVGRLDLLTMKFLSHRTKDQEHLEMMKPSGEELAWIRNRVTGLVEFFPNERGKIEMTLQLITAWNELQ